MIVVSDCSNHEHNRSWQLSIDFESFTFVSVSSSDTEMSAAIQSARDSLRKFFEAFESPRPDQQKFLLKVRFEREGKIEHIWLADLDLRVIPFSGVVANEPRIPGLTFMERATFSISEVTDWMYFEGKSIVGGFTTKLLVSRAIEAEPWWTRFLPWRRKA